MRGTWLPIRRELRQSWLQVALVGLLVGALGAFALTAAIGAHRADTAWGRLVDSVEFPDVFFQPPTYSAHQALLDAIRGDADVRAVTSLAWIPLQADDGSIGQFGAFTPDFSRGVYRPRVVAGRLADQRRADEVMMTPEYGAAIHKHVGDTVQLRDADAEGYVSQHLVQQEATIVGFVRGPIELGPNGRAATFWLTYAFMHRYAATIYGTLPQDVREETIRPFVLVKLHDGADPAAAAKRILAAAPAGSTNPDPGDLGSGPSHALRLITWALAGLAVAGGATALVAGTQAVTRVGRRSGAPLQTLAALGMGPRPLRLVAVAPAIAAAIVAALVAAVGADVASALVPTGLAHVVEPHPGRVFDATVMVPGLIVLIAALVLAALWSTRRAGRRAEVVARVGTLPAPLVLSPARAIGVRAGLGFLAEPGARRRARSTLLISILGLFGIAAVTVLLASGQQLLGSPARYGYQFQRAVELRRDTTQLTQHADGVIRAATSSPDVAGVATLFDGMVDLGGTQVEAQAISPIRGSPGWQLLRGRPPAAPDEVVLGSVGASDEHVDIGDTVELGPADGSAPDAPFRIVGIAAISALGNGDFGEIVWVHPDAAEALGLPQQPSTFLLLADRPGHDVAATMRSLGLDPAEGRPTRPVSVGDLREVGSAPWTFAAVLGVLIVAALTQTLAASVRAQRRETAILCTLGFVRRQVHAAVRWQAATVVAAGIVIGVPLGIAVGATAWRRVATSLGVDATPASAWLWLAGLTVATLVIANLVALWPARRAGRLHPAEILRSE